MMDWLGGRRTAIVLAAIVALMAGLGWFMGWEKRASEVKPVPVDIESD